MQRYLVLFLVSTAGCDLIKIKIGPVTATAQIESNTSLGGGCEDSIIDRTFSFDELTEGKAKALGNAECLQDGKISLRVQSTQLTSSTRENETCSGGPRGTVTLDAISIEYEDGKEAHAITFPCEERSLQMLDAATFESKVNTCLDTIINKSDEVRRGLNSARKVHVLTVGSCTPDSCFHLSTELQFKLEEAHGSIACN